MPGLFGFVKLDPHTEFRRDYATNILEKMSRPLIHRDDYIVDTFVSQHHGLAIARISHPRLQSDRWPKPKVTSTLPARAFLHGVLQEECSDALAQEHLDRLPSNAESILLNLSGFYSLAMINRGRQCVIVSTDRRASEPIYYLEQDGMILFAPEVKALLAVFSGRKELNIEAASMLLACGYLLGDQTLVPSIKKLPGGCFLEIQEGQLARRSYWSFRPGSKVGQDSHTALQEELAELLNEAVRKNLGDPKTTAIFLSGGSDSRGILGGALVAVGGKGHHLNTVSWGVRNDVSGTDAAVAEQLAHKFHLTHRFFERRIGNYSDFFEETNYIVDASCDVAAFHPYEFTIMKKIQQMGFDRVLRGDKTFGPRGRLRAYNYTEAQTQADIRSLRKIEFYSKVLRTQHHRNWMDTSDDITGKLRSEVKGMAPNDARDYNYFTHYLQRYLNTAAYYKQVVLDHRNPLLDESILDFMARVPWRLRMGTELYRRTVLTAYPDLWVVPIAGESGLEDWANEFVSQSPLRRYFAQQLNDVGSGIWEYFERSALIEVFESLPRLSKTIPRSKLRFVERPLRTLAKGSLFFIMPRLASRIQVIRAQSTIAPYQGLLRFLVLKNWHDKFISSHRMPGN